MAAESFNFIIFLTAAELLDENSLFTLGIFLVNQSLHWRNVCSCAYIFLIRDSVLQFVNKQCLIVRFTSPQILISYLIRLSIVNLILP